MGLLSQNKFKLKSECGFDPHLRLRNRFSDIRAYQKSSYHPWYHQTSTCRLCATFILSDFIINISRRPRTQYICRTWRLARHLSLSGSMAQRSSEGCGVDPSLGFSNRFFWGLSLTNVQRSSIFPSSNIQNTSFNKHYY